MAGFFNYSKPGKGISKEDVDKSGIALYFDILFRRFWKLLSINILYLVASIPAILISFFIANYIMSSVVGFLNLELSENLSRMMMLLSIPFTVLILQATGSGPATVAVNYVLGKYVKDTHSWVWSDFKDNIKNNFKQGIAAYIINTVVFFACAFSFLFYSYVLEGQMILVLRTAIMVFSVVFFFMQFYVYRLIAEFKLKIKHVYKNALLLTILGLKWNLLAAVVVTALMVLTYTIFAEYFAIGMLVVFALYFALQTFTQIFITNNVVKKYLLEPAMQQMEEESAE